MKSLTVFIVVSLFGCTVAAPAANICPCKSSCPGGPPPPPCPMGPPSPPPCHTGPPPPPPCHTGPPPPPPCHMGPPSPPPCHMGPPPPPVPLPHPITPVHPRCCGYTPNTIHAFFYSVGIYEDYSFSYYDSYICKDYGIKSIPPYMPTLYYDDFDRMVMQAKCNYMNSLITSYPTNYGYKLWEMSSKQLIFDYILIGATPSTLTLAMYLSDLGYTVAIVDSGLLPPPQIRSPYYSLSVLGSPFVKRFPAYIPGLNTPKTFYTANMFGGINLVCPNHWVYGNQYFYEKMTKYSSLFDYKTVQSRFSSFSISTHTCTQTTTITNTISSWWSELGYKGITTFDHTFAPGFTVVPTIGSNGLYSLYIDEIFSKMTSYNNIYLFLGLPINRLIYQSGSIVGVELLTPNGPKIIRSRYDVIIGSSPVDMFQILTRSGIGNPIHLKKFGITPYVELPALGTGFRVLPKYVNPFILFPKYTLVSRAVNDYSALQFVFGQCNMSSLDSLINYRAFLKVGGSLHANAMYEFYAFNDLMMNRLEYVLRYYFQYTSEMLNYAKTLLMEYDILFITVSLTESKSIGYLDFGDTIEDVIIQTKMYSNESDIIWMIEAIQYLQQIIKTTSFMNLGVQVNYLTPEGPTVIGDNFFTAEYIRSTLPMYSFPSLQPIGGAIIGNSITEGVVNHNFNFYNINNLFALGPAISPISLPYNNLAFNTLLGSFAFDIIQKRISSNFYSKITVDSDEIDVSLDSIDVSLESVDVSIESTSVSLESVDVSMESIDVSMESIDVSMESIDVSMESIDVSMDSIDVSMDSIDVSLEDISGAGIVSEYEMEATASNIIRSTCGDGTSFKKCHKKMATCSTGVKCC